MGILASDLIQACGGSRPETLSTYSDTSDYLFPNDWYFSFTGVSLNTSGPFYPGDTITINVNFVNVNTDQGRHLIENRSNFNISLGSGLSNPSWVGRYAFQVDCTDTADTSVSVTYSDAIGNGGNTEQVSFTIESANSAPNASLYVANTGNYSIDFSAALSTDPDGDSLEYRFDEGDTGVYDTSWGTNTDYSVTAIPGDNRTVTVQVRDPSGLTDTATATGTADSNDGSLV